jgi:hypothetical protein
VWVAGSGARAYIEPAVPWKRGGASRLSSSLFLGSSWTEEGAAGKSGKFEQRRTALWTQCPGTMSK